MCNNDQEGLKNLDLSPQKVMEILTRLNEHSKRLQRIRVAHKHFNKMETNLPNNNNYEIKVKHTNSKYCRFCIRHEIPKLIKDNYLPGKVLEKINTHSYSGFVHYAKNI